MRISDWSSDVCSSDLLPGRDVVLPGGDQAGRHLHLGEVDLHAFQRDAARLHQLVLLVHLAQVEAVHGRRHARRVGVPRSEEHTSELQSLMRISYAVFCLNKKKCTSNSYYITRTA